MDSIILTIAIFTMCAICIILLTMGYIWRFSRRFTNWAYGSTNDLLVGSATLAWAAFYFMGGICDFDGGTFFLVSCSHASL